MMQNDFIETFCEMRISAPKHRTDALATNSEMLGDPKGCVIRPFVGGMKAIAGFTLDQMADMIMWSCHQKTVLKRSVAL